jgi:adenosine deaminase
MSLTEFIKAMPKAELHVHLQGGTQPSTLLKLAQRHRIPVPATTLEDMRQWYNFRDFDHFLDIYDVICECFRTGEDIELAFREFCAGQAAQNIRYTEVTFTPPRRIAWAEQLAALKLARDWARDELGIIVNVILDIPREYGADVGNLIADWVIDGTREGVVVALGLAGPEADNPAARFADAFDRVRAAGIPTVIHAGEHAGPESIWDGLNNGHSARIGHGVRCLEDPTLVDYLREHQIPLEVCPTSNVLLKVCKTLDEHPLPKLMDAGLRVSVNSDDPPMFNITLTEELIRCARMFGWDADRIEQLTLDALQVAFCPQRQALIDEYQAAFNQLRQQYND